MTPLRARLAAAAPGLDDATLDAMERAALPLVWDDGMAKLGAAYLGRVTPVASGAILQMDFPRVTTWLYPTEAAAREALETAVMEAIYG